MRLPPEAGPLPKPIEALVIHKPGLEFPTRFAFRLAERWSADSCSLMAAALAFFGLLSLFPLALAGVAILARVLTGNTLMLDAFSKFVGSFFPASTGLSVAQAIQNAMQNIANGPSAATASIIAVASLLWSGRSYFDTLATVLTHIEPGSAPRSFFMHQLALLCLLAGAGALFFASSAATFALAVVQALAGNLPHLFINRAPVVWDLAGKAVSYALTFGMFFVLYRWTPNRRSAPSRRVVLASALVATLGWEIAKWAFTRFLGNVTRYETAYGSIAGVVVTMMWIYFSSIIVLMGAEFGATWEEFRAAKAGEKAAL